MLKLRRLPTLASLMALEDGYSAERWLELQALFRPLVLLQEYPDIAIGVLSNIYMPPHQRMILYQLHRGAGNNLVIASRGTAKSSTVCVLYTVYMGVTFSHRKGVMLSATGFRGGQNNFNDAALWLSGGWDSQLGPATFFRASIPRRDTPVSRGQSQWSMTFDSHSMIITLPTKDPEAIRGIRGQDLSFDEANFLTEELIDKVAIPFLNVTQDMRHGGAFADPNRVFYTTTVDYSWRPFQKRVAAARQALNRDVEAKRAMDNGQWGTWKKLDAAELHETTLTQFDYTDLLIRRRLTTRSGVTYQVTYPDKEIPLTYDPRGIPFTERDAEGKLRRRSHPTAYYQTYAIAKRHLERGLFDGSVDEAGWKSEQRNVVDTAIGDVYSHELVDRASCTGHRYIISADALPDVWTEKFGDVDYESPIMWKCSDPCVLGVDYAPTSDFCAFVVIRIGPLSTTDFNPMTNLGNTKWSNVIWSEQHKHMSGKDGANKVRQLMDRYNLVWYDEVTKDKWDSCRAIGLDTRGGGTAVRDELCWVNDEELPDGEYRIYDPYDKDPRIAAFIKDERALPMLDALTTSDRDNDKLVEYTKGMMEQGLLYLAKFIPDSERPISSAELDIGYRATHTLDQQLRKLRQRPTASWRKFYMEGNTEKDTNKKDLWAAFIYAAKQVRAHLIRKQQIDNTPPPMGLRVTRVNKNKGQSARATGARQ